MRMSVFQYLYAFNIVPLCNMEESELTKQPPDVTECPYNRGSVQITDKVGLQNSPNVRFAGDQFKSQTR